MHLAPHLLGIGQPVVGHPAASHAAGRAKHGTSHVAAGLHCAGGILGDLLSQPVAVVGGVIEPSRFHGLPAGPMAVRHASGSRHGATAESGLQRMRRASPVVA